MWICKITSVNHNYAVHFVACQSYFGSGQLSGNNPNLSKIESFLPTNLNTQT